MRTVETKHPVLRRLLASAEVIALERRPVDEEVNRAGGGGQSEQQ